MTSVLLQGDDEIGLHTPICMDNKYFTADKTRYYHYGCRGFIYFLLSLQLSKSQIQNTYNFRLITWQCFNNHKAIELLPELLIFFRV